MGKPLLTEEAQAVVAEKYVDMRMRFQSGFADQQRDQQNPDAKRKPRLAVTTRTLEALIRLATAHAKLRLRRAEVYPEDVHEAYKLMLAAREEDVTERPAAAAAGAEAAEGDDGDDSPDAAGVRGQKRTRDEVDPGAAEEAPIAKKRFDSLRTLVARAFAREAEPQIPFGALLEHVNAELAEGEPPFTSAEFTSGISKLEAQNKVMNILDTGVVMYVG